MARLTPDHIKQMKARSERIAMLTAYDVAMARLLDSVGADILLVGDSLGNVMLGYETTLPVTVDDIIRHTQAVVRGSQHALVVADLPFGSFQVSPEETIRNAIRIMKEAAPQAVKLEGGVRSAESVRRMVEAGIPVMGHVGFTPQSVNVLGLKAQGKTTATARALLDDVATLEAAGAFAVVLELAPAELAQLITTRATIPTIGIGAGPDCDGEVQVLHDILGLFPDERPHRHTKRYAEVGALIREAANRYLSDVRERRFPAPEQSLTLDPAVLQALRTPTE